MDVKPWEPVGGWYVCAGRNPLTHQPDKFWGFYSEHYDLVLQSETVNDEGACRVTLANGQRIIVRALSEDRKFARKARHTEMMRSVS